MPLNQSRARRLLKSFDLKELFTEELGWDRFSARLEIPIGDAPFALRGIAEKRGVQVFVCEPDDEGRPPDYATRRLIDKEVAKTAREHLIIYVDAPETLQIWQWVSREPGQPVASREHHFHAKVHGGDALIQKLDTISFSLGEEEGVTLAGVVFKLRDAWDRDKLTKKFYEKFKAEHAAFLAFIQGVADQGDREWYTSLMLNRLMFVYFIQKKGFLDGDRDYLKNRLKIVQENRGKGNFQTFYRLFLIRLFHEGFGRRKDRRADDLEALIGDVPYLNGGLFDLHELEQRHPAIDVPDDAFSRIFRFFDQYDWHLDSRPLQADHEINPDVLGYIFEKYINQKQMGAYYTKEDITEYITKSTVIPHLFDAAAKSRPIDFQPGSSVWRLLQADPDRYLYASMRRGVVDDRGDVIPLPAEIAKGLTDVSERAGWNRPADPDFALPTETWREHVARRERCLQVRERLQRGEVHQINDLITDNLDLRQFAEDAIHNCESPELLRAFHKAVASITVLDPTCGSGAFLFAALNILKPLYEACLDRMRGFVDDLDRSGEPASPRKFEDFRRVLDDVDRHPNRDYFILKSIVVKNLYGVDIMEEAVEICKLRLFLKLVAQVDAVHNLEPLPDVDFNIRAGNALVGFATLDEVKKTLAGTLAFAKEEVERIVEDAEIVDRAFRQFHAIQTSGGIESQDFPAAKQELRERLEGLAATLDQYLAGDYGIDPAKKPKEFAKWRSSHEPFHWFAEFYGIMNQGGFDVIVGNPPYVELREIDGYSPRGYSCTDSGNLYALVMERCGWLVSKFGRQGYIVPVSSISTDRYRTLQELLSGYHLWYSSYDDRPSRLFDGLEHIRLTIHLLGGRTALPIRRSTRYNKWNSNERESLFNTLAFAPSEAGLVANTLLKLSADIETSIIEKLRDQESALSLHMRPKGAHQIYYSRKVGYFLQVLDFEPRVLDSQNQRRPPSEFKTLSFASSDHAKLALCCLNSSLFYWFITVTSDCRHVNKREVDAFPIDLDKLKRSPVSSKLLDLSSKLMADIQANSVDRRMKFRHDQLTIQCIMPKLSKPLIDKIDALLGVHYNFTDEETDFIINYDAKYRLGQFED